MNLMKKKKYPQLLVYISLLLFCTGYCKASGTPGMDITPEEQAWLARHPQISIGIMDEWPPLNYVDHQGNPKGIGADYIKALNRRLGNVLTIVPGPFKKNFDLVKEKKLDALMDITPKKEREPFFNFTRPYITIPHVIAGRKDGPYFDSEKDLAGKIVALERDFYNVKYFRTNYPQVIVKEYSSTSAALGAVSRGEADAYAGNRAVVIHLIEKELMTNLRLQGRMNKPDSVLSIGVRKDWPEFAALLDRALDSLTSDEERQIRREWVGFPAVNNDSINESLIRLDNKEKRFLKQKKSLRFSEVLWEPLSVITSSGQFDGMIADYFKFISTKTGLMFEFEKSDTWSDVIGKYKDRAIDVIPALDKEDVVGRDILLSDPFLSFPLVIVTRDTVNFIDSTAELNGKKVAVGRGYTSHQFLQHNYPEIILVETDTVKQAMIKLSNGDVFAFVGHMAVAVDTLQRLGMKNLKIAGETEFRFDHRIGVDPGYPEAISIINKALGVMTAQESRDIYRKWIQVEYAKGMDYSLVWKILAGAGIFLGLIIFWNRRLAGEIEGRKQAEERFTSMAASIPGVIFQFMVSPDGLLEYRYLSQRADEFFGVSPDIAISEKRSLNWHSEDQDKIQEEIRTALSKNMGLNITGRIIVAGTTLKWVHMKASPGSLSGNLRVYNGFILDITRRKLAEQDHLASERKLMAMSQAVEDALIMIDSQGLVRFWNPAAEKLFGFSADEALGIEFHGFAVPEEARDRARKGLLEFARTGRGDVFGSTIQTTALNRFNKTFPVEVTLSSFQVDDEWFAVGTVRDITERKKMEKETELLLIESRERNAELERFNRLVIGREEKMIHLKAEVNDLAQKLGLPQKYKIIV